LYRIFCVFRFLNFNFDVHWGSLTMEIVMIQRNLGYSPWVWALAAGLALSVTACARDASGGGETAPSEQAAPATTDSATAGMYATDPSAGPATGQTSATGGVGGTAQTGADGAGTASGTAGSGSAAGTSGPGGTQSGTTANGAAAPNGSGSTSNP
jgi:hypothetical protein